MTEKGDEREQPKPSPWETLASTQEAQLQNNNRWNRSDKWGQSLNDDAKWKSDGWGTSYGQKKCTRSRNVRSSRSPTGDLRQLLNRGANWREDSPSPPHCGRNATRSQGTSLVCNNKTYAENENEPGLSTPRIKLPGHNDENRHNGRGPHSPAMTRSRLRSSSPFSHAAQEVNKSNIEKESDGWGMRSSHAERSKSRSLSPWSQAAHNIKGDSDSKDTDRWGKALDQTGLDAWNQTNSNGLLPNRDSDRWRGGHGAFRSRHGRFSTDNKHSVSPENRPRRTGWDRGRSRGRGSTTPVQRDRGRYRGRGSTDPNHLSRFNSSQAMSPTDANKTKDEREKQLSFSYPQIKCSGLNEMTGSDSWSPELTKNADQKESDWWGQDSSPVKKSRSRSVSPWSQASVHINKNFKSKETDGWGVALDQTGPDAWNQPRSNISPYRGFNRREQKSRDQSRSPAPKWRKTGWDVDRPRGRDNSYSPDNKQRTGWNQGGSRYRGRGRTNSPFRYQKRSQGTSLVCNNKTNAENENEPGLSTPRIKLPGHNDENKHYGRGPHSPAMTRSRLRSSSPFSHAAQEVNKSNIEKESDGWGMRSSHAERSKSRSLSPWSQAAHNIKGDSDSKDTDRWGKALDQTGLDAWNQTNSNGLLPNRDSDRWRGGHGAFRSRDGRFSTDNKHSVSPENRPRRTGWDRDRSRGRGSTTPVQRDRGRYRGRGSTDPNHLSRFNSSQAMSPTDANKTKDEREKQLSFSYPQIKCSGLNEMTGSDSWGPELTKNADQKESDWWGQDSSPVKKSRSRSVSPWSQASVHINKNFRSKETDGWGVALDQTGLDAWNQPRSNLSPYRGFNRRGQKSRDQSRSPAPKWRKTGWDVDRPRGRDNSYSPDNKQRTGWNRGGSRYRGRGRTNSPYRYQKRREKRDSSYSPISSRRSPSLQRSPSRVCRMDQDREKRDGSEGRYEKNTNYRDNAAKVTSWEGPKWRDWSVNALRSSLKDPNLIYNWGAIANTGHGSESRVTHTTTLPQSSTEEAVPRVEGNTTAILDAYCKTKQREVVLEENISQELQISSQYHDGVKEKVGKNSPGIEHPMNPITSQWDNDVCIASSHGTDTLSVNPTAPQSLSNQQNPIMVSKVGLSQTNQNCVVEKPNSTNTLSVNPTAPQSLSNQQNPIIVSKVGLSQTNQNCVVEKPNTDAIMQPVDPKVGTSEARGSDADSELSAINPADPTPEVPKLGQSQLNQNLVAPNGTAAGEKTDEVDNHSFKLALVGFAKPKLKPFWLKRYLKEADYQQILHKFVNKVTQSLRTFVPQTHENCCKFVKEQNNSLSKFLQMYLERFVSEDVIKNMRFDGSDV